MFPTVRFLDKETGFDTSDMRRLPPVCLILEADRQIWGGQTDRPVSDGNLKNRTFKIAK